MPTVDNTPHYGSLTTVFFTLEALGYIQAVYRIDFNSIVNAKMPSRTLLNSIINKFAKIDFPIKFVVNSYSKN